MTWKEQVRRTVAVAQASRRLTCGLLHTCNMIDLLGYAYAKVLAR
jgi:hypothetical protein